MSTVEISGLDSENLAEFDLDILFDDTVLNFNQLYASEQNLEIFHYLKLIILV